MTLRTRASLILLTLAIAAASGTGASAQRAVTTGPQNAPLTAVDNGQVLGKYSHDLADLAGRLSCRLKV